MPSYQTACRTVKRTAEGNSPIWMELVQATRQQRPAQGPWESYKPDEKGSKLSSKIGSTKIQTLPSITPPSSSTGHPVSTASTTKKSQCSKKAYLCRYQLHAHLCRYWCVTCKIDWNYVDQIIMLISSVELTCALNKKIENIIITSHIRIQPCVLVQVNKTIFEQ